MNDKVVEGNANLFDGSELKTTKFPSEIYLKNGPHILLGVNSAAIVHQDLLALEQGAFKAQNLYKYSLQLGPVKVQGESVQAGVLVRRKADEVEIATLSGSVRLVNETGVALKQLRTGSQFQLNIAGQSVMVPDQSGAVSLTPKKQPQTLKQQMTDYAAFGLSVAGSGLAVGTLLQKQSTSP